MATLGVYCDVPAVRQPSPIPLGEIAPYCRLLAAFVHPMSGIVPVFPLYRGIDVLRQPKTSLKGRYVALFRLEVPKIGPIEDDMGLFGAAGHGPRRSHRDRDG